MKYITESLAESLYEARKKKANEDYDDVNDTDCAGVEQEELEDDLDIDEGVNIKKLAQDIMDEYDKKGNMENCVKSCVKRLGKSLSDKEIRSVDTEMQKLWDKACAEYDDEYEEGEWDWTRDDGRPGRSKTWESWFVVDEARWVTMKNKNHALIDDDGSVLKGGDPKTRKKVSKKELDRAVKDANAKSKAARK